VRLIGYLVDGCVVRIVDRDSNTRRANTVVTRIPRESPFLVDREPKVMRKRLGASRLSALRIPPGFSAKVKSQQWRGGVIGQIISRVETARQDRQ